jgi:tripartite-type tricarboxylate transporter receptor subunit TctC
VKTKDTLVVFLLTLFMAASWGQEFPSKPVRLIVPFPTGGGSDLLARILAQRLHTKWGQPVIVENRAGAGGNLGAEYVARSEPDGHTLLNLPPGRS